MLRCGHCKTLEPEFLKAAQGLDLPGVALAKVDVTDNEDLAKRFRVSGYPTIKLFVDGEDKPEYDGDRTAEAIQFYMTRKSSPPVHLLATASDIDAYHALHESFALGIFSTLDAEVAKQYAHLAAADINNYYTVASSPAVRAALDLPAEGDFVLTIRLYVDEPEVMPVTADTSTRDIELFITKQLVPLLQTFSPATSQQIFSASTQVNTTTRHCPHIQIQPCLCPY